jgi:hypothetical protein
MNNIHPTLVDAILPFVSQQTRFQRKQLEQEKAAAEAALDELRKVGTWVRLAGSHDRYMIDGVADILVKRIALLNFKLKELG